MQIFQVRSHCVVSTNMFTIILWTWTRIRIHDGRLVILDAEEGFAMVFVTYDANDKKENRTHYIIWLYIIVMLHKTIIYTAVDIVHGHPSLGCKKKIVERRLRYHLLQYRIPAYFITQISGGST